MNEQYGFCLGVEGSVCVFVSTLPMMTMAVSVLQDPKPPV